MSQARPDGEVSIQANGRNVAGWTEVSISGGLDMAPAVFDLAMTERTAGELADIVLNPGDPCTIKIGGDLVLTGYINRYVSSLDAGQHMVRVSGRSRLQDLVDCSAMPKNLSLNGASIVSAATDLVAPFAGPITVLAPDGDGDHHDYVIGVSLGETPWEIISEIATYEGRLIHDDARGDLVIANVGTTQTASGFGEGVNIQSATATNADDMLFSDYIPVLMAQDSLQTIGPGGNSAGAVVKDPLVWRYRPLVVVSDQMVQGVFLAQKRAVWEATRRRGRARAVSLVCDSWRDAANTLWTHNVLAAVDLPTLHISGVKWIIASWKFVRDGRRGTVAEIMLMPAEAFAIAPSALNATNFQTAQANLDAQRATTSLGERNPGAGSALTSPNAGAGGNVRAKEGYGL